ncbi:unnamed protein product, partial [Amoebophrya sp. A25]
WICARLDDVHKDLRWTTKNVAQLLTNMLLRKTFNPTIQLILQKRKEEEAMVLAQNKDNKTRTSHAHQTPG